MEWHGGAATEREDSVRARFVRGGLEGGAGIRLQAPPFSDHEAALTDIADYRAPQELGSAMRSAGVQAFEYRSARCPERGCNVALFTPAAFTEKRPRNLTPWLCETTAGYVAFKPAHVPGAPKIFSWELFWWTESCRIRREWRGHGCQRSGAPSEGRHLPVGQGWPACPEGKRAEDFERHCPAMGRQEASAKICAQMESSLSRVESVRL